MNDTKKKLNAIKILKETGRLNTKIVSDLGLPFEFFLKYCQMNENWCREKREYIINTIESKYGRKE